MRIGNIVLLFLAYMVTDQTSAAVPVFNGQAAFQYLQKQCDFGPRDPGSSGYVACREYLLATLRTMADQVEVQKFPITFGSPRKTVSASNIIARFQPALHQRLLLCAHWDTRPWADMDAKPANRRLPILGANDGASGVAVLLEIARLLKAQKTTLGIDLVLFDGEDIGESHKPNSYARGSAAFAEMYGDKIHPRFGILLDMVGDSDLQIFYESYSVQSAAPVVRQVWQYAQAMGISEFVMQEGYAIYDDHMPLLQKGIPCIDIIDFDYPYWHTMDDRPDKCSAASLEKVGRVITAVMYGEQ
jgi:glutaminyl-peptide cyclotransferase